MESTVYKHSLFIAAGLRVVGECILAIFDSPGVKANLVPCTVKLNVYKKRTNCLDIFEITVLPTPRVMFYFCNARSRILD